jgi:hypothetical protein
MTYQQQQPPTSSQPRQPVPSVSQQPQSPSVPGSQTSKPAPPPNSINVNNLGYYLDGWVDIVEGMGEKVDIVRSNLLKELIAHEMPQVQVSEKTGYVSLTSNERRPYLITSKTPGATTTIYIGKHGKDLFASWRTFVHLVVNQTVILVTLGICAILGLFMGGIRSNGFGGGPSFSFGGWVTSTIILAVIAAVIMGIAGRIIKGSFTAFFFMERNLFDAEDTAAMSLTVHKSIFRALDVTGIDITKLRLKRDFKGGRRGEDV